MSWSINNGTEDLPVTRYRGDIEISWVSGQAGVLTVTFDPDQSVPAAITLKDADGNARFVGTLDLKSLSEAGRKGEQRTVRYLDAWARLERRVVRADFPFDTFAGTDTKFVIGGTWQAASVTPDVGQLGQYELIPIDIGDSVTDAIDQAGIASDVTIAGTIPPQEVENVTIAAVVKAACRWFPDAQMWVHPGTSEVQVKPASGIFSIAVTDLDGYDVTPRTDLVVPGAALTVRKAIESTRGSRLDGVQYSAGTPDPDFLHGMPIAPERHSLELAAIRLEEIDPTDVNWWAARDPKIKAIFIDNPSAFPDRNATPVATQIKQPTGLTLTHEVTAGSIPQNFVDNGCSGPFSKYQKILGCSNGLDIEVGEVTVSARFQIRTPSDLYLSAPAYLDVQVKLPACVSGITDSGIYAHEDKTAEDPGEDPAIFSGVPALIVNGTAKLGYEGTASWRADELPDAAGIIGKLLRITGTEFATMDAPIFSVTQNVHTRLTTIRFGINDHLGPNDYVELIRAARDQRRRIRRRDTDGGGLDPLSENNAGSSSDAPGVPVSFGTVRVDITPSEAVDSGAAWFAIIEPNDGQPDIIGPFPSEQAVAVPVGRIRVLYFQTASGWISPGPIKNLTVTTGAAVISGDDAKYEEAVGAARTPFRLSIGGTSMAPTAQVSSEGSTVSIIGSGTAVTINDLDNPVSISSGDKFWIEYSFATGEATIQKGSSWWTAYPDDYAVDGSEVQTYAYKKIGQIVTEGSALKAKQLLIFALRLEDVFTDARTVKELGPDTTAAS